MSGETEVHPSGWSIDTLHEHYRMLRDSDQRFQDERDRRYSEVNIEREKALKIKETADLAALSLAREIQDYKDEKANNLREQITGERGHYATKEDLKGATEKFEAVVAPLVEYVSQQRGGSSRVDALWGYLVGAAGIIVALVVGFTR